MLKPVIINYCGNAGLFFKPKEVKFFLKLMLKC